jgi:alpha-tubulin suppressor-like RCC1 family protein
VRFVWLAAAALIGCEGPRSSVCAIACSQGGACPPGTTCSAGFCAPEGRTCEPAFQRVEAGTGFACALDQFQRWWCWGSNEFSQIDTTARGFYGRAVLASLRRWEAMSLGGGHACGIEAGELWCWGRNDRSQVSGSIGGDVENPLRIEVPGRTVTWSMVSAGSDYTCAIGDGQLYCWGAGELGKLGHGGVDDSSMPRLVASDVTDWMLVVAGGRHTCAVSRERGVHCWGDGSRGQLGIGRADVIAAPEPVALDAVSLALGLESTCAVTAAGELWCWGRAQAGALGDPAIIDPDEGDALVPVRASDLDGWLEVASAERYACARRGGEVWCWGSALAGGLGDGRWRSVRGWTRVLGGATSLSVAWNATASDPTLDDGDHDLTCAVVAGDVQCWGDNRTGQLGQGAATSSELPLVIAGDRRWRTIEAGDAHACGISATDVLCWGSREVGQVDGTEAGRVTPCTFETCASGRPLKVLEGARALAIGAEHTCALHDEAAVTCWGGNADGQAGGAPGPSAAPRTIPGTWAAVHAGARGSCAGALDGEAWCWGHAITTHALDREPALDGAEAIALGGELGCALLSGRLACFGASAFGNGDPGTCGDGTCNAGETVASCEADCGPPPMTHLGRRYRAIATGRRPFACGLREDGAIECWGDNRSGQAGATTRESAGQAIIHPVTTPFVLPDLVDCTRVATGAAHACAICSGGLRCWGEASHGEIGPPITRQPVPRPRLVAPVDPGDPFVDVTAGDGFTCARTQRGRGFCWGRSLHGALGTGATGANLPVAVQR